jgi:hypothetical protein
VATVTTRRRSYTTLLGVAGLDAGRRLLLAHCLRAAACIVGAALVSGASARADETQDLEIRVKAAFLCKFAGYVEWPPGSFSQAETPVTIAVVGAEPLAAELSRMVVGRTVGGRALEMKRMRTGELPAGIHILFVGRDDAAQLSRIAGDAKPHAVLTVTDSEGALEQGSMINFVLDDRRVRFDIALDTAARSGLRLSSRLLAVARDVRTEGR